MTSETPYFRPDKIDEPPPPFVGKSMHVISQMLHARNIMWLKQ